MNKNNNSIKVKVDSLGRIVIPVKYRKVLNIYEHDLINLEFDNNKLIIYKPDTGCVRTQIEEIKNVAYDSACITSKEYVELCDILDKLYKR